MFKRFGSALRIGLSNTGATVVRTSGWMLSHKEILAEWAGAAGECDSPEYVIGKLGELLREVDCSRTPTRIVLSDSWVRRWMVTPPRNAASLEDCRAAAGARFQALFGDAMSGWHLAADWDARHPFLACAIPLPLMAALRQVASEHGLILLEVTPQFVAAWNSWRKALRAGAWFGVVHHKALAYAVLGPDGPEATRDATLNDAAIRDQQRVPEILAREALRLNVPMPAEICLCGQIPPHWVMQNIGGTSFVRLDRDSPAHVSLFAGTSLALTGMHP